MTAGWCEHCADVVVRMRGEWLHADSLQRECDPARIQAAAMLGTGTDRGDFGTVPAGHPILGG